MKNILDVLTLLWDCQTQALLKIVTYSSHSLLGISFITLSIFVGGCREINSNDKRRLGESVSRTVVLRLVDFILSNWVQFFLCLFRLVRAHLYIAALEDDKRTQRLRNASCLRARYLRHLRAWSWPLRLLTRNTTFGVHREWNFFLLIFTELELRNKNIYVWNPLNRSRDIGHAKNDNDAINSSWTRVSFTDRSLPFIINAKYLFTTFTGSRGPVLYEFKSGRLW